MNNVINEHKKEYKILNSITIFDLNNYAQVAE